MFISNFAMTQWVYFDRSVLTVGLSNTLVNVHASNHNSFPHQPRWFNREAEAIDPWISRLDHGAANSDSHIVYGENGSDGHNLQKGGLVFVARR